MSLSAFTGISMNAEPLVQNTPMIQPAEEPKPQSLTNCPDCEKEVSKRAVMCPHCGCPGDAIHSAVAYTEELARPKAVVSVISETASGVGVAIEADGLHYVVFDAFLLAGSSILELHDVVNDKNVAYTEVQLALNTGLMRLRVDSEDLSYLQLAPMGATPVAFVNSIGMTSDQEKALVSVDASGKVCSVAVMQGAAVLSKSLRWKTVTPRPLRQQLNLLAELKEASKQDKSEIPVSDLPSTWLTPYFSNLANKLTQNSNSL